MILGHNNAAIRDAVVEAAQRGLSFGAPTELEIEMAKLVSRIVPSMEQVRMVSSGTEATMSAIRLARGFTSRDKIIKFEGCYHGHADSYWLKQALAPSLLVSQALLAFQQTLLSTPLLQPLTISSQ